MNYWSRKEEYKEYAISHTKEMRERFKEEIRGSINTSRVYDDTTKIKPIFHREEDTSIILLDTDSVSAIIEEEEENLLVLNFASYKNPGGMFMNGSSAQEESLCRESYLYNVLSDSSLAHYYTENNKNKNKALYTNRAILSPAVLFREQKYCTVLTCAAPNFTAANKYQNVSQEENNRALKDRIRFVLDCCLDSGCDTLILGAFGCGVFGQDPEFVAKYFKGFLEEEYKNTFKKVIFAIPRGRNYEEFEKILTRKK